jgi:hypothetical protein
MTSFLAIAAGLFLGAITSPQQVVIIQRPTAKVIENPLSLLDQTLGESFARERRYWRFDLPEKRAIVFVAEDATGLESMRTTRAFLTELRNSSGGLLRQGSVADQWAREHFRNEFFVEAEREGFSNIAVVPELVLQINGTALTRGRGPTYEAEQVPEPKALTPNFSQPPDVRKFNAGHISLGVVSTYVYPITGRATPMDTLRLQEAALKVIVPAVEEATQGLREAYDALQSSMLAGSYPEFAGKLPGSFAFTDLPKELQTQVLASLERDPGRFGFPDVQSARQWLERGTRIEVSFNLLVEMTYRRPTGRLGGVGFQLGTGRRSGG